MWSTTKEKYINTFKKGNESWIGHLELLLWSHEEEIVSYDVNDQRVHLDNLYFAVGQIELQTSISNLEIPLDEGEYLTGSWGYYQKRPVLIFGIGSPHCSAGSTLIINKKDQPSFEDEFRLAT